MPALNNEKEVNLLELLFKVTLFFFNRKIKFLIFTVIGLIYGIIVITIKEDHYQAKYVVYSKYIDMTFFNEVLVSLNKEILFNNQQKLSHLLSLPENITKGMLLIKPDTSKISRQILSFTITTNQINIVDSLKKSIFKHILDQPYIIEKYNSQKTYLSSTLNDINNKLRIYNIGNDEASNDIKSSDLNSEQQLFNTNNNFIVLSQKKNSIELELQKLEKKENIITILSENQNKINNNKILHVVFWTLIGFLIGLFISLIGKFWQLFSTYKKSISKAA